MNPGSTNQTTTQQSPSWQQPYQNYGLNQAYSLYNRGPTVAPFSPMQEQALGNMQSFANNNMIGGSGFQPQSPMSGGFQPGMAMTDGGGIQTSTNGTTYNGQPVGQNNLPPGWSYQNGNVYGPQYAPGTSPGHLGGATPTAGGGAMAGQMAGGPSGGSPQQSLAGAGSGQPGALPSMNNWVTNTLNGNPAQNPYLNSMFNQAADSTQNRLASEFAGAGRGVTNSLPLRSDELNNLATNIYGGAYNTGLQQQDIAASMAPNVVSSEMGLQQGLYGGGQQVQNLAQQYANAPANWLNQYLGQTSPGMGTSTTTPYYYNQGAGALGGALVGSQLGQQAGFSPWMGALGGAILGG